MSKIMTLRGYIENRMPQHGDCLESCKSNKVYNQVTAKDKLAHLMGKQFEVMTDNGQDMLYEVGVNSAEPRFIVDRNGDHCW